MSIAASPTNDENSLTDPGCSAIGNRSRRRRGLLLGKAVRGPSDDASSFTSDENRCDSHHTGQNRLYPIQEGDNETSSSFPPANVESCASPIDQHSDTAQTFIKRQRILGDEVSKTDSSMTLDVTPSRDGLFLHTDDTESKSKGAKFIYINGEPFKRLEFISSGGAGRVYKVSDAKNRVFALKRVCPPSKEMFKSFQNEVALLHRLKGKPHIVQVHQSEINYQRQRLSIVMELGECDLTNHLKKAKKLSICEIRTFWKQLLKAVQVIHDERIVHGDLKPDNFLVVDGKLKLIDFGIAKAISNDTTNIVRENQVGTISYMAPEAVGLTRTNNEGKRGQKGPGGSWLCPASGHLKLGRSSDIWSLGVMLYQMVFRKTPFSHLQPLQRLLAIADPNQDLDIPDIVLEEVERLNKI
eukprot:GHVL01009276.1.p1 GENE.GHVL01009276.1~~GHVL01009276.1.p1  ORF type:complete len:419 (+),score=76.89 GHVL01009276.1:23-1258(+)